MGVIKNKFIGNIQMESVMEATFDPDVIDVASGFIDEGSYDPTNGPPTITVNGDHYFTASKTWIKSIDFIPLTSITSGDKIANNVNGGTFLGTWTVITDTTGYTNGGSHDPNTGEPVCTALSDGDYYWTASDSYDPNTFPNDGDGISFISSGDMIHFTIASNVIDSSGWKKVTMEFGDIVKEVEALTSVNVKNQVVKNVAGSTITGGYWDIGETTIDIGPAFTVAGGTTLISDVQTSADTFSDNDTSILTAAAIADYVPKWTWRDTNSWDFEETNLTNTKDEWIDLDLSSIVGAVKSEVLMYIRVVDGSIGKYIQFRPNGNTNAYNIASIHTQVASLSNTTMFQIQTDEDGKIEFYTNLLPTDWNLIEIYIRAYRSA